MRVLGIDFGERRIGLALSDPTGTLASPLPTLRRRLGKRPPFAEMERIVQEFEVTEIVIGLPLAPGGGDSPWTDVVRGVAAKLERRAGVPVHLVDERFTSARAERTLQSLALPRRKRAERGRVDALSAVLILQGWLDRKKADIRREGTG